LKISKQDAKKHAEADRLTRLERNLTEDEKDFVIDNWVPGSASISLGKAFFTPAPIAHDLAIETHTNPKSVLDICAGIGSLSLAVKRFRSTVEKLVCVELNEEFVRVGRKIVPEAQWICADVFNEETWKNIGQFDDVISNPPFGKVKRSGDWGQKLQYTANDAEFLVAEIALRHSQWATFVLPQSACPFQYSGKQYYMRVDNEKYNRFNRETGINFHMNCGIDTSVYLDEWKGVRVQVEIVIINRYGE
jgi:predicted RNA methylase